MNFIQQIFKEGWFFNVVLYGLVFILANYAVYNIIFKMLIQGPKNFTLKEIRYWRLKASMWSSIIFAPIFEEIMFTYLSYLSFLEFAQAGMEGVVMMLVASFFALLHLPGDLYRQRNSYSGIDVIALLKFQFHRFFYSLAAYLIFIKTGSLLITICIHYLYNGMVFIFQYEVSSGDHLIRTNDMALAFLVLINFGFGIFATFHLSNSFPNISVILYAILGFLTLDVMRFLLKNYTFKNR